MLMLALIVTAAATTIADAASVKGPIITSLLFLSADSHGSESESRVGDLSIFEEGKPPSFLEHDSLFDDIEEMEDIMSSFKPIDHILSSTDADKIEDELSTRSDVSGVYASPPEKPYAVPVFDPYETPEMLFKERLRTRGKVLLQSVLFPRTMMITEAFIKEKQAALSKLRSDMDMSWDHQWGVDSYSAFQTFFNLIQSYIDRLNVNEYVGLKETFNHVTEHLLFRSKKLLDSVQHPKSGMVTDAFIEEKQADLTKLRSDTYMQWEEDWDGHSYSSFQGIFDLIQGQIDELRQRNVRHVTSDQSDDSAPSIATIDAVMGDPDPDHQGTRSNVRHLVKDGNLPQPKRGKRFATKARQFASRIRSNVYRMMRDDRSEKDGPVSV